MVGLSCRACSASSTCVVRRGEAPATDCQWEGAHASVGCDWSPGKWVCASLDSEVGSCCDSNLRWKFTFRFTSLHKNDQSDLYIFWYVVMCVTMNIDKLQRQRKVRTLLNHKWHFSTLRKNAGKAWHTYSRLRTSIIKLNCREWIHSWLIQIYFRNENRTKWRVNIER